MAWVAVWLGIGRSPGFGRASQVVTVAALFVLFAGLQWRAWTSDHRELVANVTSTAEQMATALRTPGAEGIAKAQSIFASDGHAAWAAYYPDDGLAAPFQKAGRPDLTVGPRGVADRLVVRRLGETDIHLAQIENGRRAGELVLVADSPASNGGGWGVAQTLLALCAVLVGLAVLPGDIRWPETIVLRAPRPLDAILDDLFGPQAVVVPLHASATPHERSRLQVLAAMPDIAQAQALTAILHGAGLTPHVVATWREALEAWRSAAFDAVVIDLQADPDAADLVREIRAREHAGRRGRTRIVAFTGDQGPGGATVDQSLAKPIRPGDLLAAVVPSNVAPFRRDRAA